MRIVYSVPSGLRLPAVLATAVATAEAAALLLRPRDNGPEPVMVEARAYFSPQELEKARRFRRGQLSILAASLVLELALLAVAARRAPRPRAAPVLGGAAAAAGLSAGLTVATLPLAAWARRRAKAVGLVTQSWGGWAGDVAKQVAISGALAGAGGALLLAGTQRFGRAWWLPGAGAALGLGVVFTYAGPVVLDPVFNRFTPLPEGATRSDVLALARRAGVDVGEVFEVDASRRTTACNAYVAGLGRTKRVVLYDNLLKDFTPAEVRLVIAHELGHVRHRDVVHGLLWVALVAPAGMLAAARLAEALGRPGALGTPGAVPATALAFALVGPAIAAISNQLSRAVETRADRFALGLTGEPETLISFERRITVKNVGDPAPPRWLQLLLGTHPTTMERIGQALAVGSQSS